MGAKSSQRNPPWTLDELILALDFYFVHRRTIPDKRSEAIAALSREINATAHRLGLTGSETLRIASDSVDGGQQAEYLYSKRRGPGAAGTCQLGDESHRPRARRWG